MAMSMEQAREARLGDVVIYQGRRTYITAIQGRGIAAPLFRLSGVEDGLTSYQLVEYPEGIIGNEYGARP